MDSKYLPWFIVGVFGIFVLADSIRDSDRPAPIDDDAEVVTNDMTDLTYKTQIKLNLALADVWSQAYQAIEDEEITNSNELVKFVDGRVPDIYEEVYADMLQTVEKKRKNFEQMPKVVRQIRDGYLKMVPPSERKRHTFADGEEWPAERYYCDCDRSKKCRCKAGKCHCTACECPDCGN